MRPCPSCSRANGSDRHACIYCGTALVDDAVVARETVAALLPRRPRGRRGVAVAVLAGQQSSARAKAVAAIFGCEPFAASQLLRRPVALLFRCGHASEAAALEAELHAANLATVELDYAHLDDIPDAELLVKVEPRADSLALETVDGKTTALALDDLECVIVGRVEVESTTEMLETRSVADGDGDVREIRTRTKIPRYDAFTVFDLYASGAPRARLVETVCTIEGSGYPKARRGAGFARFVRWLEGRCPALHVDERYLQLGKEHRKSEHGDDGRVLSHGLFRKKEVVGTEEHYSGQGFDDYSVIAWTIWRLSRASR